MTTRAPRRPTARRAIAAATALAAAAGVALGLAVAPGAPPPPAAAAPPAPRIGLASGVARLPLPADWRPLRRRSTLPGFGRATAVRAGGTEAALDLRLPDDPSLLPAGVVAAVPGRLPAPQRRGPDGRTAWRYDLPGARPGSRIAAFALPTTGGVVTIACAAPEAQLERAAETCERAVATVRLRRAAALPPAPETAAAILLPEVAARLNAVRRSARGRLAATRSPGARSAAALRIAGAYAAAAQALRAGRRGRRARGRRRARAARSRPPPAGGREPHAPGGRRTPGGRADRAPRAAALRAARTPHRRRARCSSPRATARRI